jgi:hypothetical protein
MIRHTVCFSLVHPEGSTAETAFLRDARAILTAVPGVADFAISRQVGTQSDLRFQFAMTFPDAEQYAAYDAHPDHQGFVRSRWVTEVAAFQELDFIPYET